MRQAFRCSRHSLLMVLVVTILFGMNLHAQYATISGTISDQEAALPHVNISLKNTILGTSSNEAGYYTLDGIPPGRFTLVASAIGYRNYKTTVALTAGEKLTLNIVLETAIETLGDIVVTGTLKPVNRLESPVPVEVDSCLFATEPKP